MKPVTAAVVVVLILAIPLFLKTHCFFGLRSARFPVLEDRDHLYDIDDFLT
jgi:hypothetical protein